MHVHTGVTPPEMYGMLGYCNFFGAEGGTRVNSRVDYTLL